jgi:hypothetical protein
MILRILFITVLCTISLHAQTTSPPDTSVPEPKHWKQSLVSGLTITQQSYSNWTQGGSDALAYNLSFSGKSVYDDAPYLWTTSYVFAFGQSRIGDAGLRKTDDRIDLEMVLTYRVGNYINPYVATTLKTQFDIGYKYDNLGKATSVSTFFDPAFLTQSLGAGYQILPELKTRAGVALRETFTSRYPAPYADDPKTTTIERQKIEGGMESVTDAYVPIETNVLFTSKFEVFATFKPGNKVVLRGDNTLTTKVGRYVTLVFNVQLINDRTITARTQWKQTMAIGLSYTVF